MKSASEENAIAKRLSNLLDTDPELAAIGELFDELRNQLMHWSSSKAEKQQTLLITNYSVTEAQRMKTAQDICKDEMRRIAAQLFTTRMIQRLPPEWRDALRTEPSHDKRSPNGHQNLQNRGCK